MGKGKCNFIQNFISCRKSKTEEIPPPPAPALGPPPYDQTHASMSFFPPPPMGWGVSATCQPQLGAPGTVDSKEGFNVWGITGYSGFVRMPQDNDAVKTLAQLETMKQVMGRAHSFDLGHVPIPPPPPPPPPPAPTKDGAAVENVESIPAPPELVAEPKPASVQAVKKVRRFETITIHPPPHKAEDLEGDLACYRADCQTNQPVKKIKSLDGKPVCWFHVVQELENDASKAWQES